MDFEARRRRLFARVGTQCDAILITNVLNVAYLTGFVSSNSAVLVTSDDAVLATDGRYQDQAAVDAPDVELIVERNVAVALLEWCSAHKMAAVGFESGHVTVAVLAMLEDTATDRDFRLVPMASIVEGLRAVKDDGEVALLKQACEISVAALRQIVDTVGVGMTELHIARSLELAMAKHGADDRAFETIVATGPNSAIPHHQPTSRPISAGDLVKIDFGAKVSGYHADCTRTYVVGAEATDWQSEIHAVVSSAATAGREALEVGAAISDIDAAARDVVSAAGFAEQFSHGLGHGVGLEIHESPLIAASVAGILESGFVVTVEPGIYLPGLGGVRIEDTCAVATDAMTIFTQLDRELVRLD